MSILHSSNYFSCLSGYVYDAVWLYGLALDKLVKQDKTFLQNLHSNRSVKAFVNIIKEVDAIGKMIRNNHLRFQIDFEGVSGRINFFGRSSRLSNIDIIQWRREEGDIQLKQHKIGVYRPNYTR